MQVIDGAQIAYEPGRVLDCRAVSAVDDPTPFNFLDHYDYPKAAETAMECAEFVTKTVLGWRDEKPKDMLVMPQADSVFDFITNQLGMQPLGRLAYVSSLEGATFSGLTVYNKLTAFVIKDKIDEDFEGIISDDMAEFINGHRVANVAAHELTHLAGAQDRIIFTLDPENLRAITRIESLGATLEEGFGANRKGAYFEEGLGTLVGAMHIWDLWLRISHSSRTEVYQSPNGTTLTLPKRINAVGHHKYAFAALGIERLVDVEPDVWDVLMDSRKYGRRSEMTRYALKQCVDRRMPGLFEVIDTTDVDDLDQLMETTERIQFEAHKQVGHME